MWQVGEMLSKAHAMDVIIVDVTQNCDFANTMVICTGALWPLPA